MVKNPSLAKENKTEVHIFNPSNSFRGLTNITRRQMSTQARKLGVTFDSALKFDKEITCVVLSVSLVLSAPHPKCINMDPHWSQEQAQISPPSDFKILLFSKRRTDWPRFISSITSATIPPPNV